MLLNKGNGSTYNAQTLNSFNPDVPLKYWKKKNVFKKIEKENRTKYDTFYTRSKAETIISENDIDDVSINIQK